jgi:thiopurine S-methyltransferase
MDHAFWDERWRTGRIGFHAAAANPRLVEHRAALGAPAGRRVLVPLCGKTHDLTYLASLGFTVVGVEFVAQAAADFFSELGQGAPASSTVAGLPALSLGPITILVGDFFALAAPALGPLHAIYDRAALVAVPPAARPAYAAQLAALASPGAGLLLINFTHDMGDGPPFTVPDAEVRALFGASFAIEKLAEHDILDAESRFRERGATFMNEQVWRGRRG